MSRFTEELTPQLIKRLADTPFCRPRIAELAQLLGAMPLETANQWVRELAEAGEDQALTRLLNVFAYCGFKLEPGVLVQSCLVTTEISSVSYIFAHQDARAIPHLCQMARSEEPPGQLRILYGRYATELALRYGGDQDKVRRLLQYLSGVSYLEEAKILVYETLVMLDSGELKPALVPILTAQDIKDHLPERPPPKVISGGGTLRRPVAKVGRNDPCHCGSGKKYKRCCASKDGELLADASEYAGITQTQLLENPGIVDDPHLIRGMRAYEIKKLDPATLGFSQLIAAFRSAMGFGMFEIALAMLVECSQRGDLEYEFDQGHFVDLMERALNLGNMEVAERARKLIPTDYELIDWDEVEMQFELNRNPGVLATLERHCGTALDSDADIDFLLERSLCNLSHILRHKFPALGIVFARAAVMQSPESIMDNEHLVEITQECRSELGLEPWGDPIEQLVFSEEREFYQRKQKSKNAAVENDLRRELAAAREQAKLSSAKLTDAAAELQKMKKELAAKESDKKESGDKQLVTFEGPSPEQRATMERLRRQIDNLKVEISNQQEQRQKLRQQLERAQNSSGRGQESVSQAEKSEDSDEQAEMPSKSERRVVVPEYKESFKSACSNMPAAVAGAALKALSGIAAYDAATWKNFRAIKQLTNIYRIRIGIHYRLLILWLPGERLCALDLIPRQDLESWIKRHAM
ncbi:MAG: SEC-C metal-binding domain-containing protein [Kiritimatiellae bacterium]|nr:SEC-C metal-binding domain-containing protein [Kiritimatiellia bacterium]